jgi:hypothetical protein
VQSSNRTCKAFLVFVFALVFSLAMIKGARAQQPAAKDSPSRSSAVPSAKKLQPTGDTAGQSSAATPDSTKPVDAGSGSKPKAPPVPSGVDPKTGVPLYETIQEDWSSLAIGISKLEPEPPLIGQIEEHEGFTRTLVRLKWRPGDPLDLYVILPTGVKNPPAVLYLYGYKEDTDRFRDDGWCQRVTQGGTAAIGFVSALSGQRFHDRPLEQWFVSELQESLGSTVHDVKFILDYLAQRGDIDMNRIGMFGQASGGAIALLAAAADARIEAVDVLDPWGDWPVWLAKSPIVKEDPHGADFARPEFLQKVEPLDPVKWLPTLRSTHVRIEQVMDNRATPDACKDALREAAPKNAEIVRFEHLSDLSKAAGPGHLFDWIKAELKGLPPSAPPRPGNGLVTRADPKMDKKKEATASDH